MTVTATPAPFPFEGALRDSLEIFQKNAVPYVILLLIAGAPAFLGNLLVYLTGLALLGSLLSLVGAVITIIAVASVQIALLDGSNDLTAARAKVMPRLLPLIGLALLVGIIVIIGMVLLIVPGVIAACALLTAIPLFLDQNTGVIDSLQRSVELTKGNWLRIFLMLLIFGLPAAIVIGIISYIFTMILGFLGAALVSWLLTAPITAFEAVLIVVAYRKLKGGYV